MRTKLIIAFGALVFAGIGIIIWLLPARPEAGPWKLADGSELSLAGVTHGKTNTMRYGTRVVDYLYPILTPALRNRFNCKVAAGPAVPSDAVVLWFWIKGGSLNPPLATLTPAPTSVFRGQNHYAIATVDENGMESSVFPGGAWAWSSGSNLLECWTLTQFPRRSKEIKLRIYNKPQQNWLADKIADFTIPNPLATNYPVWEGKSAPITVETNGLNISLTKFEVGEAADGASVMGTLCKTLTRAEVTISDPLLPLEWQVHTVTATSATGESRKWWSPTKSADGGILSGDSDWAPTPFNHAYTSRAHVKFAGTCWLQEPAWKIVVELERLTNFPPEDVWTIKDVKIPPDGQITELNLNTNINGNQIEFLGLSSHTSWGWMPNYSQNGPDHAIKVRGSFRPGSIDFKITGIRDDQGRRVGYVLLGKNMYMPGASSRNPMMEYAFTLTIPNGAKSIDVTLACPKSQFVELLARPTKFVTMH